MNERTKGTVRDLTADIHSAGRRVACILADHGMAPEVMTTGALLNSLVDFLDSLDLPDDRKDGE